MAAPTFIFGLVVVAYFSTFVLFALLRVATGISIQRIGYFSLRRIAYTFRDGLKVEIRGIGLNVHRPTFAQPTWLSIRIDELVLTVDIVQLEAAKGDNGSGDENAQGTKTDNSSPESSSTETRAKIPTSRREAAASSERSKTWRQLTRIKDKIKRLHRQLDWLRLVDVVATNSSVNILEVGNIQVGSFTIAVDTRRKMINRARFFLSGRTQGRKQREQAEWIMTARSVLFTADGGEALEILDTASLNVYGYLYEALDGLRDASVALKLGRVHIPYDDIRRSTTKLRTVRAEVNDVLADSRPTGNLVDQVIHETDGRGTADQDLMQTVSDSKEFVSSILRGVKEVQFAVSFVGLTKKIEAIKTSGPPMLLSAAMKEVGIDLHRLDPKSPAHRMYFPSKDIAHEGLAAALSISVGVDEGQGKSERLLYIPMATTTVRTTLPSKTVELTDEGTAEERNGNILFANSVVTSPSVDLDPRHLPLLLAMLRPKLKSARARPKRQRRHLLISRLLPKANVKFSMHEPVIRIALPPVQKSTDPDEFDLIISSISSVSLDMESFHSAVQDRHYSLVSTMRMQTHRLYYQTSAGARFDLLETDSFDVKVQLNATPDVQVVVTGALETLTLKMVRPEITDGLRQIVRQLRLDVEPDKRAASKTARHPNFLRGMPSWLLHFQMQCSECGLEVAGVDPEISRDTRGVALQLESWSLEYRAHKLDETQRGPSRRRTCSRASSSPNSAELLKALPLSPRKKYQHVGDGRRLAMQVRGLEAFIVETADKLEVEPFVNIPQVEVTFSTLSDKQGPVFHVHTQVRTLLAQYSLYRHYSVLLAATVLRKAFMPTKKDLTEPKSPVTLWRPFPLTGYLSPDDSAGELETRAAPELMAMDFKATLIQVKADMPANPPLMLHVYNMEAGRQRWSPPFFHSKLIRLYAEAPRMRRVWAKMVSIRNGRVDLRESRRKLSGGGFLEDRMFDVVTDGIRIAVPHEMIVHRISDNCMNAVKSLKQLHHRFRTGTNEYILDKGPQGPKNVPRISLRSRTLMFELEDGAFEWKLGVIYRSGRVEQMQRLAREEAFRVKVKKIHEEESRRDSSRYRAKSAKSRGRSEASGAATYVRSVSADGRRRFSTVEAPKSRPAAQDRSRGRDPRYDPEGDGIDMSGTARISIAEARRNLNMHNARSWKKRIDRQFQSVKNGMKEHRAAFWGRDDIPDDMEDSEDILEVPHRPALMSTVMRDLHLMIDKPSFPMKELPDFLHKVGKGMPRDMQYSLLVPMNVQVTMGEATITLRDYPLPLLHVPSLKPGQSSRLAAMSIKTDFVLAEEFRGMESMRRVMVQIVPPTDPTTSNGGSFAIDVRRTIGPVKSYSDVSIDINSARPTRFTWGPCYQPAIQDMMMALESLTKPQLDPSERIGFWDKIRLSFHSRLRVAWRGDGDVHLALKGTRDPYQITSNGAGFLMCWRNDVRWSLHADDDPKRFMTVDSGEYVLAIPDYSHEVRESRRHGWEDDTTATDLPRDSSGASFKKVVMKLSGKVQWMAGLVFERAVEHGNRNFNFRPHYEVVLRCPQYAKAATDEVPFPYDAFRGFRSQHIHLSIAVRAPVDREWSSDNKSPSRSYNAVHLTPRFFTHFFSWWSLFSGPLSLPIRQGSLWPGREKSSKKFGRHLATIKHNLLLAPVFFSHMYKHKDAEDYSNSTVSATGIKVRFDSWMLDLHQRREEFNTRDRGGKSQSRTSGMKIHAAQLDLVSADIRAVSARIRGTTAEAVQKRALSALAGEHVDDATDLSRFTIPDNDFSWIDMDDFVELDWILPTEPNPETKILPLVYAPRITYFRQTDIGGVIDGDPDRTSPFGQEPTHLCIMSQDDDPKRVQMQGIRDRLEQLEEQMRNNVRDAGDLELRMVRGDRVPGNVRDQLDVYRRHLAVLGEKKTFMETMLRQTTEAGRDGEDAADWADGGGGGGGGEGADSMPGIASAGTELASDFKNRFVVHNMQLKWNNTLRNIILRYIHQVSQRRGFVYYLSRPAVKFILDIVEEQTKSKTAKGTSSNPPSASPDAPAGDGKAQKDIEDRIRRILQEGKKFVNADKAQDEGGAAAMPVPVAMGDLSSGIAEGFTPQNSYDVRLMAPQIQLQSDKNKKHVCLITAKGMELKVVEVMDKDRVSDNVSGLVQRRFLVNMDSTQFFVTHQKWFQTQLVSMYTSSNYGAPTGSSWPPWVPMEVMFDFATDPFGFRRVVQKTSAMLRYDKYNGLRLKYNDEINEDEAAGVAQHDTKESRVDNLWVDFPQAHALCNSSQYYAIYVIVLDLLMYNEPLERTRSERLEKIMLASDFSDLRGAPEMLIKLQERIRQLEDIKTHFQTHADCLDEKGWHDRLALERDLAACGDELFFTMKAITTSQRKFDSTTGSSALLRWSITAREIVWHLMRDTGEPLVEMQLKDVEYDRTDNSDGSHINLIQVGSILGLNLLPDAMYPVMMAPHVERGKGGFELGRQPMMRVYWNMLEAIAGIPVMDHFEVNLFPLKVQLERDVGTKLFEYIFPGLDTDAEDEKENEAESQSLVEDAEDNEHGQASSDERPPDSAAMRASLELRLRPTLTSDQKTRPGKSRANSAHAGAGDGGAFKLFRTGTGSKSLGNNKASRESLQANNNNNPGNHGNRGGRPAPIRTSTGFPSREAESKKGARFSLGRSKASRDGVEAEAKPSDDLTKMIDRASNYMTFAYIKMPSVVLCLSYKGKGDRNLEDVHDFVFRLPTIEFRNKTWSNLDLALALKSRVIKALISHTGAIIGNKFSKHRPNTAQQNRLRELATSSVLLSSQAHQSGSLTPSSGASQRYHAHAPDSLVDSGDDSSSLFGSDALSRSPASSSLLGTPASRTPAPRARPRSSFASAFGGSSSLSSSVARAASASRSSSVASSGSDLVADGRSRRSARRPFVDSETPVPHAVMNLTPPTPIDGSVPDFVIGTVGHATPTRPAPSSLLPRPVSSSSASAKPRGNPSGSAGPPSPAAGAFLRVFTGRKKDPPSSVGTPDEEASEQEGGAAGGGVLVGGLARRLSRKYSYKG